MASSPITRARPVLQLAEPRLRPWLPGLVRAAGGIYMRGVLKYDSIVLAHPERFVDAFGRFMSGRTRLLVAFRHPYGDEPQTLAWATVALAGAAAGKAGTKLPERPHVFFIHGYEVPLWGGPLVRWILPRSGSVPIHHAKLDSAGLARVRALVLDGEHPVALAPEGQTCYHSEIVDRLEKGVARLALWCAGDLAGRGRAESVEILPVSFFTTYLDPGGRKLARLLSGLERRLGLAERGVSDPCARVGALTEAVIAAAEKFYDLPGSSAPLRARLELTLDAALTEGERMLGLPPPGGDPSGSNGRIERVYRIRQRAWDAIYRDGLAGETPLGRALADRRAGEAFYASRHMEWVDLMYYFDPSYAAPGKPRDRLFETAINLADAASRLACGNISDRPDPFRKRCRVLAGEPIAVVPVRGGPAAGKAAADGIMEKLRESYEKSILEKDEQ
ncbi:MAG: hypothetical protein NT080_12820 [Spirochaetes bacterium]|nr:hypothetical protein [Spirochaetota bacterium]